jgi:hypothetical protein
LAPDDVDAEKNFVLALPPVKRRWFVVFFKAGIGTESSMNAIWATPKWRV